MKEEVIKCYCGHTTTCDCGPKEELELKDFDNGDILDVLNMGNIQYLSNGDIIYNPNLFFVKRGDKWFIKTEKPKQETLEEITKIICHTHKTPIEQANEIIELLQQQMYSEEEVDKMISDFKHDLIESTSNYVKQNCEGAIFGLSRLKNSKKK